MIHKMTVTVNEPVEIEAMMDMFNFDKATYNEYFEFGEYATIELEVDEALKVVGGRFVPNCEL